MCKRVCVRRQVSVLCMYRSGECLCASVCVYAGKSMFYVCTGECLCASMYVYTGKSYLEWFTELVESLESNMFPRIDGRIYR